MTNVETLPPRGRRLTARTRGTLALAALLVPALVMQATWIWWPTLRSIFLSFTTYDGILTPQWVGLGSFRKLLSDPLFYSALGNNVRWVLVMPLVTMTIGLGLALGLNQALRGQNVYKTAIYLPGVLSLASVSIIWSWMYQPEGLVNMVLRALGLGSLEHAWLAEPSTVTWAIMAGAVWHSAGFTMIIYLAGLKAVPPELEQAAQIDGANSWQTFWHVTFPMLRPMHVVVLTGTVITALKTFDMVWVMTKGGPYNSSDTLATYMFGKAFENYDYGVGSAAAVVIVLLCAAFVGVYVRHVLREI